MAALKTIGVYEGMYVHDDHGNLVECDWGQIFVFGSPEWED